MKGMKRIVCVAMAVSLAALAFSASAHAAAKTVMKEEARRIDLAICLDTSGSMGGLINAARQKLWDVVSELALAKPAPELRVALLSYGHNGGAPSHITVQTELTNDLDTVYQKLMALGISGSQEYVGWVLHDAVTELKWSDAKDALKLIFVAGNESADQAKEKYDFRNVCADAIKGGIMVNSIYCGSPSDGIAPGWREVSQLADGSFAAIDQNNGTIEITTPFDKKIAELGAELNTTYVAYGAQGKAGAANQIAQDSNSAKMGMANFAARNIVKAQALYRNSKWDLVDARNGKDFDLSEIKKEDLPENMQEMTAEEQNAHLDKMEAQRKEVQTQINDLASQRREFIEVERKKMGEKGDNSFDAAMLAAVRSQAEKKNFTFRKNFNEGAGDE